MTRVEVRSGIAGNVWKVESAIGDRVETEQTLVILESMKMEIPLEAPCPGKVLELHVKEGDVVEEEQIIAIIDAD